MYNVTLILYNIEMNINT